jgi:hypothetical protein
MTAEEPERSSDEIAGLDDIAAAHLSTLAIPGSRISSCVEANLLRASLATVVSGAALLGLLDFGECADSRLLPTDGGSGNSKPSDRGDSQHSASSPARV